MKNLYTFLLAQVSVSLWSNAHMISSLRELFSVQAVLRAKDPTSNNSNMVICFRHSSQSPSQSGVVTCRERIRDPR